MFSATGVPSSKDAHLALAGSASDDSREPLGSRSTQPLKSEPGGCVSRARNESTFRSVAIRAKNRVEFVACDFGSAYAGLAPVGIHDSFDAGMTADVLEHCNAVIHVCEAGRGVQLFAEGKLGGRMPSVVALFVIRGDDASCKDN